jgi:DNA polymerase III subunit chi
VAEFRFYHLERRRPEQALPTLLERAYADGQRVLVRVASDEQLAALNTLLWTYDDASFLPHGAPGDGDPLSQPIFLTTHAANANAAAMLVLLAGSAIEPADSAFDVVIVLFDGRDPDSLAEARERWKLLKDEGQTPTYWREGDGGGWERA